MGKQFLAVLVAIVVGGLTISAIESINIFLYPWPDGLNIADKEAFNEYMAGLPTMAFVTVLIAHATGTFIAGFIAAKMAIKQPMLLALIAATLLLAGAIYNLTVIPHPMWFMLVDVLLFIPAALLGARQALKE